MTSATATGPEQPGVEKKRVPFWDNARFICVTLVVIGHGIQKLTADSDSALVLYLFLYAFHIPAFAIISGYFSKATPPDQQRMLRIFTDILVPYLIMESIWTVVKLAVENNPDFNPSKPSWTLWFLLALAIFRVVLPYLVLVRWPLFWTVIASMAVGYWSNVDNTFALSRVIGLLPFFLFGWKLSQWGLIDRWRVAERRAWWIRAVALGVLGLWLGVVIAFRDTWREIKLQRWFFFDDPYVGLVGEGDWWGGFMRLAVLVLAVILCAAFFVLVPRSETWFTGFGQATMYIYLLHSFVLYPIRVNGVLGDENASTVWVFSMILASIAISIALASPLVRRVFRPLIEPKPRWLFPGLEPRAGQPSRTDPTGSRRT